MTAAELEVFNLRSLVDARLTQARAIADLLSFSNEGGQVYAQSAWAISTLLEDVETALEKLSEINKQGGAA